MVDSGVLYAGGYKRAGDLIVEHAITHGEQHILVYPAVSLYRQYIELQLKEIMRNGYCFLGIPEHPPTGFPTNQESHRIDKLWRECRDILKKMDQEEYKKLGKTKRDKIENDLAALEQGIDEFSKWDPDSTAFRYPIDKKGNPSISHLSSITFRSLKELIERISFLLDGISVGVSEYLKAKHEMNSNFRI